jgi:hypothetical protein
MFVESTTVSALAAQQSATNKKVNFVFIIYLFIGFFFQELIITICEPIF